MKIYNTLIHDGEREDREMAVNIAVLETENERKLYSQENYGELFSSTGYSDEDIFYYINSDDIPENNKGCIEAGDVFDFIIIITANLVYARV